MRAGCPRTADRMSALLYFPGGCLVLVNLPSAGEVLSARWIQFWESFASIVPSKMWHRRTDLRSSNNLSLIPVRNSPGYRKTFWQASQSRCESVTSLL